MGKHKIGSCRVEPAVPRLCPKHDPGNHYVGSCSNRAKTVPGYGLTGQPDRLDIYDSYVPANISLAN